MALPVGTDLYAPRAPRTTPTLVVLNGMVYVVTLLLAKNGSKAELQWMLNTFALSDTNFRFWQPITYQFLHDPGDIWHLLGNMAFLWAFGVALESRMRWWGFALLYLTGGMAAAALQMMLQGGSAIGASGSASAVTGAFVVIFPRARITLLFLSGLFPVPAMLLVALYVALDFFGVLGSPDGVAHWAHLGGVGYGFVVACALLATGLLKRTDLDLVFLLKQMRRRQVMRSAVRQADGQGPWEGAVSNRLQREATAAPKAPQARGGSMQPPPGVSNSQLAKRLHEQGTQAFARGEFDDAARLFQESLRAAPTSADADQTRLMLAVIYARKLDDPAKAREHLAAIGLGLQASHQPLVAALRAEVGA